jgi:pilus assembly protein CpaF
MFNQPQLQPLAALLAQTGVTDLVINGHGFAAVLVGGGWQVVGSGYESEVGVAEAARLLVGMASKQIDFAHPFASADLDSKFRVHVLLASAVNPKTHISIRVHARREVSLQQLRHVGAFSGEQFALLKQIVASRETFLISGSAGAGKTTLLRAMLNEVEHERIVTIEDVAELQLASSSVVSLVARESNLEGKGEISLNQLLIESLRMRADRIVIGEVRSAELITLLQASSSGHSAASTLHANSLSQVAQRVQSIAVANSIDPKLASELVNSAVTWRIHINKSANQRSIEIRRSV